MACYCALYVWMDFEVLRRPLTALSYLWDEYCCYWFELGYLSCVHLNEANSQKFGCVTTHDPFSRGDGRRLVRPELHVN
jgi:hypothetical protein